MGHQGSQHHLLSGEGEQGLDTHYNNFDDLRDCEEAELYFDIESQGRKVERGDGCKPHCTV